MIRKTETSAAIFLILMTILGCSKAPAVAIFSTLTHWILTLRVINLRFPFLTYPCLGAVYAFTIWLAFF
jgi:hypothetical protein